MRNYRNTFPGRIALGALTGLAMLANGGCSKNPIEQDVNTILPSDSDKAYKTTLSTGEEAVIDLHKDILRDGANSKRVRVILGNKVIMQSPVNNKGSPLEQVFVRNGENWIKYDGKKNIPDYDEWQKIYVGTLHQAATQLRVNSPIREALGYAKKATTTMPEKTN